MERKKRKNIILTFVVASVIRSITVMINKLRLNFTFMKVMNRSLHTAGYHISKIEGDSIFPFDFEKDFKKIFDATDDYTESSIERMYAMYQATKYIIQKKVPGDIVECGVWKGGSMMISAIVLQKIHSSSKILYLYDTFTGKSKPTYKDVGASDDTVAENIWKENTKDGITFWCYESYENVRRNLISTGYPIRKMRFIKGKVEDTIPKVIPEKIALLRLDTDWYESTYHELAHLYPRLVKGGVLLIDDYGHWKGAREAVDQYFREHNIRLFMHRIDYTGRIGIKV